MGKEKVEGEGDLKKSLDENLEKLGDLLKSAKSKDALKEMMKDSDTRKKVKEYLKDYDEDDEDDKESMNGDEDEGEDEENEEEEMKPKKKIKKSMEEVVEENEDLIDAVPVLKSFVSVMTKQAEAIEVLTKKISDIDSSIEKVESIQKSIGETLIASSDLIKSLKEETDESEEEIPAVRGARTTGDLVFKSFGKDGEDKKDVVATVPMIRDILLKSVQAGEIESKEVSKWELSRYSSSMLSAKAKSIIEKNLK